MLLRLSAKIPNIKRISVLDQTQHVIADSDLKSVGKLTDESKLISLLQGAGESRAFFERGGRKYLRLSYSIDGKYDSVRKSNIVGAMSMDLDLSNAEQRITAAFKQTMWVVTGFLFLFWVVQYAFMRSGFLRWLQLLTLTAQRFGKGDFAVRAHVKSSDELGQLAIVFNHMATEVERSNGELKIQIGGRKRAEESLSLLASIVESSDDAIISKTIDGHILSWNAGATKLYGYFAAEVVGHDIARLLAPDRPDEESQILARIKKGEVIEHYETVRVRKSGEQIDVSLSISPIKDSTGEITRASTHNITERKRMELELIIARDAARDIHATQVRVSRQHVARDSHAHERRALAGETASGPVTDLFLLQEGS